MHEELKRKREEALNDPNNPLYNLQSKYYRNNFNMLNEDKASNELKRFPLFKLLEEFKREDFHNLTMVNPNIADVKHNVNFKFRHPIKN